MIILSIDVGIRNLAYVILEKNTTDEKSHNILKWETIELLEVFASSSLKFDKIYIKEHHLLPVNSIIKSLNKTFPPYEVIKCTASEAFNYSDIVYIANGSSVLLESVVKKKGDDISDFFVHFTNTCSRKSRKLIFCS